MNEPEDKFSFYAFIMKFFGIGMFVLVIEFSGVVLKQKEFWNKVDSNVLKKIKNTQKVKQKERGL